MSRAALAIAAAAVGAVVGSRPLAAQDSAGARLTLGGRPPAIETEAQLRAFLDELETQQFAIGTALTAGSACGAMLAISY